jgi:pyruvate dehydrogenase E2 component (dihydrolipoamide acetyltransferase)
MADVVTMPKLGFDMAEGTLVRWVIQEGEPVAKGAVLAEIETDKATVEVESNFDGIVAQHLVKTGDIVPINTPIAVIAAPGEKVEAAAMSSPAEKKQTTGTPSATPVTVGAAETGLEEIGRLPGGVRASPLARRMALDAGLDLTGLNGSGPAGRITKKDVESFLQAKPAVPAPGMIPAMPVPAAAVPSQRVAPLPSLTAGSFTPPPDQLVPLSKLRATIGRRLVEVKQQVPHFYVTHEYDVEAVIELRKQINAMLPDEEKISVNDFVVKAVALALRNFPNLNASLQGDHILRHGQVNVGVAVALDSGLLTVVCRDTDRKPLRQVAMEIRTMVARTREGKVRPDDIEGSTFSVSNLGMFDVESFIAIINPPEAAILAIGSAREIPVVKNGNVQPGMRMKATISVDHRVSDGAEAARFLQTLAQYLEQPLRLLL